MSAKDSDDFYQNSVTIFFYTSGLRAGKPKAKKNFFIFLSPRPAIIEAYINA